MDFDHDKPESAQGGQQDSQRTQVAAWKACDDEDVPGVWYVRESIQYGREMAVCYGAGRADLAKAAAHRIVRAVNAHDSLVAALKAVSRWRGVGMDHLEHFEDIGEMFYRDTHYLRPGKSEPMETYSDEREKTKAKVWQEWCQRKSAELDAQIAAALSLASPEAQPSPNSTSEEV